MNRQAIAFFVGVLGILAAVFWEQLPLPDVLAPVPDAPPGEMLAVIVRESEDPLPAYVDAAVKELRAAGVQVRVEDPQAKTGLDQVPAEVRPHLEAAIGQSLPVLAISYGGVVDSTEPLPKSQAAIVTAVVEAQAAVEATP